MVYGTTKRDPCENGTKGEALGQLVRGLEVCRLAASGSKLWIVQNSPKSLTKRQGWLG